MQHAQIVLEHIVKQFYQGNETITILNGLNARFAQGHSYAITGISGTGKSTLMHIIAGFEKPTQGRVLINGQDVAQLLAQQQRDILFNTYGFLFQKPYLIKELTVAENVMLKGLIGDYNPTTAQERAHHLLDRVGLLHKAKTLPGALSGGEQQRVALARALFMQPQFLLADEPTAHLDEISRTIVLELLLECLSQGVGLIVSSHDMIVAQAMATHYTIHDGILIEQGR